MKSRILDPEEFIRAAVSGSVCVVDVRSPKEFAQGHIPGAINLPLLNDEERHVVGLTYKQSGQEAAVRKGFELVGHKFHLYIDEVRTKSVEKPVYVYCWRGGLRSNIMAWVFSIAGLDVALLKGGYKAFRNRAQEDFRVKGQLIILAGKTGVGKSEILQSLRARNEGVLDLEVLANHKGSSFGGLGQSPQDTQEHFENKIGIALFTIDQERVWIESESRFIGKLRIPDDLFARMEQAPSIEVVRSFEGRMARILLEYGRFDHALLEEKTRAITKRMGGENVKESVDCLQQGDMEGWLRPLLNYYDKTYVYSFGEKKIAGSLELDNLQMDSICAALIAIANECMQANGK